MKTILIAGVEIATQIHAVSARAGRSGPCFRNMEPKEIISRRREQLSAIWSQKVTDGLCKRPAPVHKPYEINSATPTRSRQSCLSPAEAT
ncbi:hypothetical protein GCM10007872_02560 [Gluconobacter sphaericus NBRC 12467]|uniref:Uncharacterized protein n=1 Tax=Gluconobacter sphaericus NBRC 12467 TaxID=1307951 RepID=A0AA37WA32_9PROT|nr:hypothetical protein GCM10007872_02560 [Gluconobacter sphaericus NBRC 12467]